MIFLRSTFGVHRDLLLVPHFIRHYINLGVQNFLFVLHAQSLNCRQLEEAMEILHEFDIEPAEIWITENWNTGENMHKHRALTAELPQEAWILSSDIDEFHQYPSPLFEFVDQLSEANQNAVRGRLVERVAKDFRLHRLKSDMDIHLQFPCEVSFGIGNPGKIMLHRNYLRTTPGHHAVDSDSEQYTNYFPQVLKVAHFKWFEGVEKKYTHRNFIAHHSETWEYSAYDACIRKNFFGWGRRLNVLRNSFPIDFLLARWKWAKRPVKRAMKAIFTTK